MAQPTKRARKTEPTNVDHIDGLPTKMYHYSFTEEEMLILREALLEYKHFLREGANRTKQPGQPMSQRAIRARSVTETLHASFRDRVRAGT